MGSVWDGLIGALVGGGITAGASVVGQGIQLKRQFKTPWDEARHYECKGFLDACDKTHRALLNVVYHASGESRDPNIDEPWHEANVCLEEARSQNSGVVLIGGASLAHAANVLIEHLNRMDAAVHDETKKETRRFSSPDDYEQSYSAVRRDFIEAAQAELHMEP